MVFSVFKELNSKFVDENSAKNYALIGFIFYALSTLGWLLPLALVGGLFNGSLMNNNMMSFNASIFGMMFLVIPIAFTAGLTVWSWITYDNIKNGKFVEARAATIILGVFGIFLGWFIGGIFLLLSYGKLGDVIREPKGSQIPYAAPTGKFCSNCGKQISEDAKFCQNCGKDVV